MKRASTPARETSGRSFRLRRVVLSSAFVVACAGAAFAQAASPVVVENGPFPNYPVELVAVEVAGKTHEFAPGRPGQFLASFEAGEDWLRQLAFRVRNKSDKAVVNVTLYGSLGTGEEGSIPLGIDALYGRELDDSAYTGRAPKGEPRRLAPGEAAEVRLSADEYEKIVRYVATKSRALADYRKVRMDVREAYFEDGTVWSSGSVYRIDPADPRKWTLLAGTPPAVAEPSPASPALKPGERIVEDISARAAGADAHTLAVTQISVNGQGVAPGQPFAGGPDWLKGLTVRVKNVSAKPIAYLQLNLTFPEARYRNGGIGFTLRYGRPRPGSGGAIEFDSKPLMPGEAAELSFERDDYEAKRTFAEKFGGVSDITRVRMGTGTVTFADGTRALVATPVLTQKPQTSGGED